MFQTLVIEWTREYLITVAVTYIFPALSGFIPAMRYQFSFQGSSIRFHSCEALSVLIPGKQYQFSFPWSAVRFYSREAAKKNI